jgi:hypothetical protein
MIQFDVIRLNEADRSERDIESGKLVLDIRFSGETLFLIERTLIDSPSTQ